MSNKVCPSCGYLFKGGDKVRAVILTEWVSLKSSVAYALGQPTECLEVNHQSCQYPQTGGIDGD